jgi:hypothetical protein
MGVVDHAVACDGRGDEQVAGAHATGGEAEVDIDLVALDAAGGDLDTGETRQFGAGTTEAARARRFVAEKLTAWDRGDMVDDAVLVASELATNAVLHTESSFSLTVARVDAVVRIAVHDTSPTVPMPKKAGPDAASGRGMRLVEAIAERWGSHGHRDGKTVWADLA